MPKKNPLRPSARTTRSSAGQEILEKNHIDHGEGETVAPKPRTKRKRLGDSSGVDQVGFVGGQHDVSDARDKRKRATNISDTDTTCIDDVRNLPPQQTLSPHHVENNSSNWKARGFQRIQLDARARKNFRWHVLIPNKCFLKLGSRDIEKHCVKLGATYPSPESAARAADQALIAMWGPMDSEEFLNFPIQDYEKDESVQRYGPDLTRYMLTLIEKGSEMVAKAKDSAHTPEQSDFTRRLRMLYQRSKQVSDECNALLANESDKYKFHTSNCGVCPSCRQPWLEKACVRYKEARELKYKYREHARIAVEGTEILAYRTAIKRAKIEGKKDIARKIMDEMYARYPLPNNGPHIMRETVQDTEGNRRALGNSAKLETRKREDIQDSLTWLITPFPPKKIREYTKKHTESAHAQLNIRLNSATSKEIETIKRSAIEYNRSDVLQYQIKRKFPNDNIYRDLLSSIDLATAEGSDILFVREDAQTWMKPNTYKLNQCSYCKTWHGTNLKLCPFMQATCAIHTSEAQHLCQVCKDRQENCKACLSQCSVPKIVWNRKRAPAPWLPQMSPEMIQLLMSIKNMATAAISEFKSPHLNGKLTPETLLALAIITEVIVDNGLRKIQQN